MRNAIAVINVGSSSIKFSASDNGLHRTGWAAMGTRSGAPDPRVVLYLPINNHVTSRIAACSAYLPGLRVPTSNPENF